MSGQETLQALRLMAAVTARMAMGCRAPGRLCGSSAPQRTQTMSGIQPHRTHCKGRGMALIRDQAIKAGVTVAPVKEVTHRRSGKALAVQATGHIQLGHSLTKGVAGAHRKVARRVVRRRMRMAQSPLAIRKIVTAMMILPSRRRSWPEIQLL